ncbi:MAG: S-adenosyl-l-methionine hydroxide adenosyltransferase family protein [Candidatus Tectimicrobiota bacterium]
MSYLTLTTDFGASPGVMKGVIWRIAPGAQIADLSHTIRPFDVRQAALTLARQVYYFPDNTIHIAVVDPGVGTARRPLAAQIGPQRFVGPDNGICTLLLQQAAQADWPVRLVHINRPAYWLPQVSDIFHGRDIFAPVAAHWAAGVPLEELGEVITDPVQLAWPRPQATPEGVRGEVSHIFSHFGNILTNIQRADLEDWEQVRVRLCGVEIDGLVRTFGDRPAGTLIALFGSSGHVMIAMVNGRAVDHLCPSIGDQVDVVRRK